MWAYESVFYQIYPLGFCNAPFENDGIQEHRIKKIEEWIPHMKKLGIDAIYFSPLFESDTHGYNTRDYKKIDVRLGTNEEFKTIVSKLHEEGIKVVLDGVFNHVGRGFEQFIDVINNRENSRYKDWFNINFGGNSCYNDGLWYEGWEGNYDLVKLNLRNYEVCDYLIDAVNYWIDYFDIDGIRLDVAYCLDKDFIRRLRSFTDSKKVDFVLIGELLHGDYNQFVGEGMLHSCTNYECYKGLYSSFNCMNMFEIMHSLNRQFGPENWTIYKGKHLLTFADNHDVTRVATVLANENHLKPLYGMLFGMPGIPCVYYGSEWGTKADKSQGDPALRPSFETPEWNELTSHIKKLAEIRKNEKALNYGGFNTVVLTNRQCVYERRVDDERVLVAINADENSFFAGFNVGSSSAIELISGQQITIEGGVELPPYSVKIMKLA